MISFHDAHEGVDLDQLTSLFQSVGWNARCADRKRLTQIVFGSMWVAYAKDAEKLVGFARAISDGASNAYVSTVVVDEQYRHRDIGSTLIKQLMNGRDGVQFVLHAAPKVHAFYKQIGFEDHPDCLVKKRRF